jgi:hypothetical protein
MLMSMSNRKDQHFIMPHRSTEMFSRMLKKSASFVLTSFRPSTGTRPPHHSAARTNLVLLIRRTVRPRGYASGAFIGCCLARGTARLGAPGLGG